MKKRIIFITGALALAAIVLSGCSSKSRPAGTAAEIAQLKEIVESGIYKINVNMAHPTSGRSVHLNSMYFLEMKEGHADSNLPYFGRAYSLPYGGGEGLVFEGAAEKYTVGYGKGNEAEISFEVRTGEDTYKFNIEIFPGGDAYVNVQPGNKMAIAFSGSLEKQ